MKELRAIFTDEEFYESGAKYYKNVAEEHGVETADKYLEDCFHGYLGKLIRDNEDNKEFKDEFESYMTNLLYKDLKIKEQMDEYCMKNNTEGITDDEIFDEFINMILGGLN